MHVDVKLPVVSGMDLIKMLGKTCYKQKHQRGSHAMLVHLDTPARRDVAPSRAVLKRCAPPGIPKQARLSRGDFLDLCHQHQRSQDGRG